ncbi:MAG: ATP-dependent DNA helicase RecQ [Ruminococcaceae bacterium]|nr:ATP-dependent DNA helicase RecQ [Oscillospiraceae bacterium]
MKTRPEVNQALKTMHIDKLRKGQCKPINAILDRNDVILIAPPSFGKSLIYQIPAILFDGVTVVIEPLLALMHDQVNKLRELGIEAAYLDSTLSWSECQSVMKKLAKEKIKVIFISPERLETGILYDISKHNRIDMVVVDECHCVTMWGSDFRKAYLSIGKYIDKLKHHPVVVALSASVYPEDIDEIAEALSMHDPVIIRRPLFRSNITFSRKTVSNRTEQKKTLLRMLKKHHKNTTIIFCTTKKAVEYVVKTLKGKADYAGEVIEYHGSCKVHEYEMLTGKKHIIVATSALSLGVDIPNVDLVIHFNFPLSIAEYCQMAGRAGREGQKARDILIYNPNDYHMNWGLLQNIKNKTAKDTAVARLDAMKELCEDDDHCIVKTMLNALGDPHKTRCRYCTNCQKQR